MSQLPQDPFDGLVLDKEEQAIEDAAEEYTRVLGLRERKKLVEEAALQYVRLNTSRPIRYV